MKFSPSSVFLVTFCACVSCCWLEGSSLGSLDASAASRSDSRPSWERSCCLSRRASLMPRVPDRLQNLSSPDGGRDGPCQWKLNHLSSSPLLPSAFPCAPLLFPTSVQQGKLYRPKGRLTSQEQWNGSDPLPSLGWELLSLTVLKRKAHCWNYEHCF